MLERKRLWMVLSCLAVVTTACGSDDEKGDDNGQIEIIENTSELCSDNVDNDKDGKTDCSDSGCAEFAFCQQTEEGKENTLAACMDQDDNDSDGKIDCDDEECKAFAICQEGEEENTLARCQDGKDNDKDGSVDCDDPECKAFSICGNNNSGDKKSENSIETCFDGEDNDSDGKIDCCDEGCKVFAFCTNMCAEESSVHTESSREECTDGEDNDKDGAVDCLDSECKKFDICAALVGVAENTRELCTDTIDNDYNGKADADDENCKLFYAAGGQYGEGSIDACGNGDDDDKDGVKDCDDPECQVYDFCQSGYNKDDDECPQDPFTSKKQGKCECGETLVGEDCYYNVTSMQDIAERVKKVHDTKLIIKQNIDLGTYTDNPIPGFDGILNGNNKRITGIINQRAAFNGAYSLCGLFGIVNKATFSDIDVAITLNCSSKDKPDMSLYAGVLASVFRDGTASNINGSSKIYVEETTTSSSNVISADQYKLIGGLFGDAMQSTISNVHITGNASAYLPNQPRLNTYYTLYISLGGVTGRCSAMNHIDANNYVTLALGNGLESKTRNSVGGICGMTYECTPSDTSAKCGGSCNTKCEDKKSCTQASDCISGKCTNEKCVGGTATTTTNADINTIEDIHNQGVVKYSKKETNKVPSSTHVGGIIGFSHNVKNSSFSGFIETNNVIGDYSGYLELGGIAGGLTDTKMIELDSNKVDAYFKVVAENSKIGGIVGIAPTTSQYIRNSTSKIDLELLPASSYSSSYYGGIAGYTYYSSNLDYCTYIINNTSQTNYLQLHALKVNESYKKYYGGISGYGGAIVNNFASDKITCNDVCSYTPVAIGGSYVYESYWNSATTGLSTGATNYTDASAEPYTYNLEGIPVTRNAKTVLGLLRYNAGYDGGVISAHIPANDNAVYHNWTTENDVDGHQIPVPADK